MQKEYAELFSAFTQFRKLHMSDLFPNMNHSEFATLMHIGGANKCLNEEKVKVSTLSERMRINITAVSRTLKVLEKKNYIQRTVSAQDRRITYVELTPEGAEVLAGAGGNNEYIYGKGAKQPEKRRRNPSDCAAEPAL